MATGDRYVTATGLRGLTRFYDPIIALTMRERLFRGRLAEQVLAGLPATGRASPTSVPAPAPSRSSSPPRRRRPGGGDRRRPGGPGARRGPSPARRRSSGSRAWPTRCRWTTAAATGWRCRCCSTTSTPSGKRAALAEAHRVLRPGGRLHIADWGKPQDPLMWAGLFTLALFDGFDGIRDHAAGPPAGLHRGAPASPAVRRHDRLRTAGGPPRAAQRPADRRRS